MCRFFTRMKSPWIDAALRNAQSKKKPKNLVGREEKKKRPHTVVDKARKHEPVLNMMITFLSFSPFVSPESLIKKYTKFGGEDEWLWSLRAQLEANVSFHQTDTWRVWKKKEEEETPLQANGCLVDDWWKPLFFLLVKRTQEGRRRRC